MIVADVDTSRAIVKLDRISNATRENLRSVIASLTQSLAALVRSKLNGGVLNRRSGRLYNSIKSELVETTTSVYGIVSTSGVPYAAIHEFGGVIKHPGSGKFQAWKGPNGSVATHFTRPHDIPMPERSYLRSSLADMRTSIIAQLTVAVRVV